MIFLKKFLERNAVQNSIICGNFVEFEVTKRQEKKQRTI